MHVYFYVQMSRLRESHEKEISDMAAGTLEEAKKHKLEIASLTGQLVKLMMITVLHISIRFRWSCG